MDGLAFRFQEGHRVGKVGQQVVPEPKKVGHQVDLAHPLLCQAGEATAGLAARHRQQQEHWVAGRVGQLVALSSRMSPGRWRYERAESAVH
mmetsp:Transcript_96367/g.190887  ORF Transcript_96367/g.190887 Transcript_96367/m.190887 type:complete len:91 (-) Transcript_96367:42-314(-)